ncbi:MAG: NUDIX hydrolase [Paracoccaceae bacterium]
MTRFLQTAWSEFLDPLFRRPKRLQVAALCYRRRKSGKEVLLITSRDTGRWILPKGWPIDGLDEAGSALQEAWEEAGVRDGRIANAPIGTFDYQKRFNGGAEATCRTQVFPIEVEELARDFPERQERKRKWVTPGKAAEMVDEPQLRDMLRGF